MILGVGIGWMREEFDSLGVPFAERAARTDDSIAALRDLWSDGPSHYQGKHYSWNPVESYPKPVQRPGIPIVIGGHTKGAARRAARIGDGFFPARADKLPECLAELRAECERTGRDPGEIEISSGSLPTLDEVKRLQDLGCSRFMVPPPGFAPDDLRAGLEKIGNELISKI
jgi:alkanesulfonate monooxygenase SsuD/methylene tetrahydromethanopterin reductase-like flavin-dependent oxidoreductase (luciferase family)